MKKRPPTVEEHLAAWQAQCRRQDGPPPAVSPEELEFIAAMRRAADSRVGFGFMQQMIEVEWNHRANGGGWGPVYFEKLIRKLEAEIEQLKKRRKKS